MSVGSRTPEIRRSTCGRPLCRDRSGSRRGSGTGSSDRGSPRSAFPAEPAIRGNASGEQREEVRSMRMPKKLGPMVLAIYLILVGVIPLINLSFSGSGQLCGILALAAGVLLL